MTETRVTDPDTGAQKGGKLERYDLIPVEPLRQVAEHYGIGARKYEDRNWERGYEWSLSYAALQRHAQAFWGGEDIDPETGTSHMCAVVFHALALLEFQATNASKDNRPKEWPTYTHEPQGGEAMAEIKRKQWEHIRGDVHGTALNEIMGNFSEPRPFKVGDRVSAEDSEYSFVGTITEIDETDAWPYWVTPPGGEAWMFSADQLTLLEANDD